MNGFSYPLEFEFTPSQILLRIIHTNFFVSLTLLILLSVYSFFVLALVPILVLIYRYYLNQYELIGNIKKFRFEKNDAYLFYQLDQLKIEKLAIEITGPLHAGDLLYIIPVRFEIPPTRRLRRFRIFVLQDSLGDDEFRRLKVVLNYFGRRNV